MDAEPGLLGVVAGSESSWFQWVGACVGECVRLGPGTGDGKVDTVAIPLRMLPVLPKLKYLVGRLASLIILRLSMISILALRFPGIWKPDLTSL